MLAVKLLAGINTAFVPESVTEVETGVVPCNKVKVVVFTVEGFIASLKVALMPEFSATPVAALAGTTVLIVGAVGLTGARVAVVLFP